jgi:hypothetical protein
MTPSHQKLRPLRGCVFGPDAVAGGRHWSCPDIAAFVPDPASVVPSGGNGRRSSAGRGSPTRIPRTEPRTSGRYAETAEDPLRSPSPARGVDCAGGPCNATVGLRRPEPLPTRRGSSPGRARGRGSPQGFRRSTSCDPPGTPLHAFGVEYVGIRPFGDQRLPQGTRGTQDSGDSRRFMMSTSAGCGTFHGERGKSS